MSQIKLKHSGGNGVIIAAPSSNPASDRTLTLPSDADGTIVSKDSSNNVAEVASINGHSIGTKNLVTNGAFTVAQRSEAPVSDDSFRTVDRFELNYGGTDNHPTQAKHALTSSDTGPYEKGFRFSYQITNADQSSGAGSGDYMYIRTKIEAQDIANSGWNYTSASSKITFSFWVKSSVSQNFYARLETSDGTAQNFPFETGSLTANQWTKITKTIPGNSNLQFDNDNGTGFELHWQMYRGTDFTDNSVANDTWAAYASGTRTKDATPNWYTTNNATFEITGVMLEVGSTASEYAHESYADTLRKCQRYYQIIAKHNSHGNGHVYIGTAHGYGTGQIEVVLRWEKEMRASPALVYGSGTNYYQASNANNAINFNGFFLYQPTTYSGLLYKPSLPGVTNGMSYRSVTNDSGAYLHLNAEL
tara:strand:+ start:1770 stop:3023 length:1254 start_codon:yes stop_codon:yes gene_type:complete